MKKTTKAKTPKAVKEPTEKIQLKDLLSAVDRTDKAFYSSLSDEQKKEFSPWLTMRFASACNGRFAEHYLIMINDLVNHNFSALSSHPELQWKLISLCGVGSSQFHAWIKPGKKRAKNKIQEELEKLYPLCKADELELIEKIHSVTELEELFKSAGYDDKTIKDILT